MSDKNRAPNEVMTFTPPPRIRLDDDDIRAGLLLELEATRLATRLEVIKEQAARLRDELHLKYGAGPEYELNDWLEGFVLQNVPLDSAMVEPVAAPVTGAPDDGEPDRGAESKG